jgi:proline iminopeptidase
VPLVLCHGGPGLSDNLGPVAALVADVALVHRYDQRGAGRSSRAGPLDVATFIADLEALRAHWGHERWVVGGHSWGANLALLYALAHPERTLGVVYLAGPGLRWGWQEETRRRRLARLTEAERAELAQLEPASARFAQLMWSTDFADRRRAPEQPLYAFPRNDEVFDAVTRSHRAVLDAGVDAGALAAPLLVVHGAHDGPERARAVAEQAPRGRYVELRDSGHSPWLEEPDELGRALREFLSDSGSGTPA